MLVDPGFAPFLATFDLELLDRSPSTAFAIRRDMRIAYVNDAWHAFARENGAPWPPGQWDLGVSVTDVTPEPLRPFYEALYERARTTATPCDHTYECSSPTTQRFFQMRVYPLLAGAFLVTNALVKRDLHPGPTRRSMTNDEVIVMCMHCRRTRAAESEQWDWVPEFVAVMPGNVSHGLCQVCSDYHYGPAISQP